MRRFKALVLCLALLALPLGARAQIVPDIVIRDKLFIASVNEIFVNFRDYVGQSLQVEGLMLNYELGDPPADYHVVYRIGPGCCSNDGSPGFEVEWPEGSGQAYPDSGAWVRAIGLIEPYEEEGRTLLRLRLLSIETLPEEGQVYVEQ